MIAVDFNLDLLRAWKAWKKLAKLRKLSKYCALTSLKIISLFDVHVNWVSKRKLKILSIYWYRNRELIIFPFSACLIFVWRGFELSEKMKKMAIYDLPFVRVVTLYTIAEILIQQKNRLCVRYIHSGVLLSYMRKKKSCYLWQIRTAWNHVEFSKPDTMHILHYIWVLNWMKTWKPSEPRM